MFFTYLRRELRRRMRQAIFIALGLALGVGSDVTVAKTPKGLLSFRQPARDLTAERLLPPDLEAADSVPADE
jgi:hypothetical protein